MKSARVGAEAETSPHGEAGTQAVPEAAAAVAGSAAVAVRASRYLHMSVGIGMLVVIALVAALYLARGFFVPLLIGILASYTLHPVVDWLKSCYVPRPAGAAVVLAALVGSLFWIAFSLSDDATAMFEKLPEAARKLRQNLSVARSGSPTALQSMQEAAKELEGAAADAGAKRGARVVAARPSEPTWLRDYTLAQSRLLFTIAAQAPIILLLTYFLLASGAHFRRKLVQFVGRSLSRKKDAVRILDEVDVQIQRYLLAMLMSNALVSVGTWLAFEALGVGQAGVWGVAARVNAAVLFIALLFFGWLWGVWGLLLGAPLVAIVKVVCDRVESLKPVGELLGR